MTPVDDLLDRMHADGLPLDKRAYANVRFWRALRESEGDWLTRWGLTNWRWRRNRGMIVDPLADQIANAHADLLFGDEPTITPAAEADAERLAFVCDEANMESELHRAARIASSEGEVWWRAYVDREAADAPLVQWVSRLDVEVLWRAGRPVAIAFVSVLSADAGVVVRHLEVHAKGETRNLLFSGSNDRLGSERGLAAHEETADLPEEWTHPPLMLAGRILNRPSDTGPRLGKSDYQGLEGLFMALNETTTIMAENARLTGKKRVFVDGKYLDEQGRMVVGDDVWRKDADGVELGAEGRVGVVQAEYTYEADQLIAHKRDQVETIVVRAGLVPQWVGVTEQGSAESGTALRVRLLPATLTAEGKGRIWTDELPKVLGVLQMLDAMPEAEMGFARDWSDAASDPTVDLGDPIPADQTEEAEREALLSTAGLRSREQALRILNPSWDDEQVLRELALIRGDEAAAMPAVFGGSDGQGQEQEEVAA